MLSYGWLQSAPHSLPARPFWSMVGPTADYKETTVKKAKPGPKKKAKRQAARPKKVAGKKAALQHAVWESIEIEELNPLLSRQFVVGTNVMLSRLFLAKGSIVPLHNHHNEQLSYVLEGALKFSIDGRDLVVHAGEVLLIPPHMPHKVEALKDS